jgi:hypothetical protein
LTGRSLVPDDKPSFLTTLPGLLTGLAALLTALAALLTAIGGLALLGTKHDSAPPSGTSPSRPSTVASPSCDKGGPDIAGPSGRHFSTAYCDVFQDAPAHMATDGSASVVGTLARGRHAMACQELGAENPVTRNRDNTFNHNTWWLWTEIPPGQATGWGWIPATYVKQGGEYQPVPGVDVCSAGGPR